MRSIILSASCVFLLFFSLTTYAQNFIEPVSSFTFNSGSVVDEKEFSELSLRKGATLYSDSERGSVLRFSSIARSYAVFNKQLLDSDKSTISFFFLWESSGSGSWHQLFEMHNQETNSNLFFTPQNGWGSNQCSLISDSKDYALYKSVNAQPLLKDEWMHIAISFEGKRVRMYLNGNEVADNYLLVSPEDIEADSLYLGCNPNRSDNYYISACLDEIKIFDQALTANQIEAIYLEQDIPEPEGNTNWEVSGNSVSLSIDLADKKQTIQNFGSSDGWNTERIGKYWPEAKKEKLAELLFSAEKDSDGNPLGIGLSSWRFNIGAGTTEQGEESRISIVPRRTEGFLNSDGTAYNWNKQQGQQWFLNKAVKEYDIHHVIGWQNSPPVAYTKDNLGFRDYGEPMSTILKAGFFDDFGTFLADVVEHFDEEGIHFDYISPLNEPQWDWGAKSEGGTVTQEGTPWTNQEIYDVVKAIDSEFTSRSIGTKLFIAEAGAIDRLYSGTAHADNQLYKFWNTASGLSLMGQPSFSPIVSYHSYFTDYKSNLIDSRRQLYDKTMALNADLELWQTEYSLLGNGYREGYPSDVKLSEIESALSLSKVLMADLNVANNTAWQWWTTFEAGKTGGEARYCLIEAITRNDNTDGTYHLDKLFYTIGHFSHFVRPGMTRIAYSRSDNQTIDTEISNVVFSAYTNADESALVVVGVNYTSVAKEFEISMINASGKVLKNPRLYLTDDYSNLKRQDIDLKNGKVVVPAYSIVTYTADLELESSSRASLSEDAFHVYFNKNAQQIVSSLEPNHSYYKVSLYNINGVLLDSVSISNSQSEVIFPADLLSYGVYLISGISTSYSETEKVLVY